MKDFNGKEITLGQHMQSDPTNSMQWPICTVKAVGPDAILITQDDNQDSFSMLTDEIIIAGKWEIVS